MFTTNSGTVMSGTLVHTAEFIYHTGNEIWVRGINGDSTDSVVFAHLHNNPEWFNNYFKGCVVHVAEEVGRNNEKFFLVYKA